MTLGREWAMRYYTALLRRATERLSAIDGLRIYGTTEDKCAIVSFNVEGVHPYDMGMILDLSLIHICGRKRFLAAETALLIDGQLHEAGRQ